MKRLLKRLLLLWLFSGFLDSFSQDTPSKQIDTAWWVNNPPYSGCLKLCGNNTPDTLRCTLIVYYDNVPAILHTKPGFVVRGERKVFLDDKKRVIKAPWEVLTYKVK